ncbi:hypothetical protein D3C72_2004260 [compost metagenome]
MRMVTGNQSPPVGAGNLAPSLAVTDRLVAPAVSDDARRLAALFLMRTAIALRLRYANQ